MLPGTPVLENAKRLCAGRSCTTQRCWRAHLRLSRTSCVTMQAFNLWSLVNSTSGRCRAFMLGRGMLDSLFLGFCGHLTLVSLSELGSSRYLAATVSIPLDKRLAWVVP